jgi:ABC-type glycerol-3-phosphate transport system substrate-binding protein
MHHPRVTAYYKFLSDLCRNFQGGFMSVYRDQAAFLFVQGNAAMIATGSWDALSLFRQADFETGIFDFPMPAPGEKYSQYVVGRANEARTGGGGNYGITKMSRHPELALDFLRFATSQKNNSQFNKDVEWLPIVIGAEVPRRLTAFAPDPKGYMTGLSWVYGAVTANRYRGKLWSFLEGQIDYENFADAVEDSLRNPNYGGDKAWIIEYDSAARNVRLSERSIAILSSQKLFGSEKTEKSADKKLRIAILKQVRQDIQAEYIKDLFKRVHGKPIPEL